MTKKQTIEKIGIQGFKLIAVIILVIAFVSVLIAEQAWSELPITNSWQLLAVFSMALGITFFMR